MRCARTLAATPAGTEALECWAGKGKPSTLNCQYYAAQAAQPSSFTSESVVWALSISWCPFQRYSSKHRWRRCTTIHLKFNLYVTRDPYYTKASLLSLLLFQILCILVKCRWANILGLSKQVRHISNRHVGAKRQRIPRPYALEEPHQAIAALPNCKIVQLVRWYLLWVSQPCWS